MIEGFVWFGARWWGVVRAHASHAGARDLERAADDGRLAVAEGVGPVHVGVPPVPVHVFHLLDARVRAQAPSFDPRSSGSAPCGTATRGATWRGAWAQGACAVEEWAQGACLVEVLSGDDRALGERAQTPRGRLEPPRAGSGRLHRAHGG